MVTFTVPGTRLECESGGYDRTLLVRLFEYDALIGADDPSFGNKTLRVKFP